MTSLLAAGLTSVTFDELAVPEEEEEEEETEEEEDWEQEGRRQVSPSLTGNFRKNRWPKETQSPNHQTTKEKRNLF